MSTLQERLRADLTAAMKARDELRMATLRMTLAAVHAEEVAGDTARTLGDDEVRTVVVREAKKRREAATAFRGAGRAELADREEAEHGVLEGYLPAQLSDAALTSLVAAAVAESGASGPRGIGAVMRLVRPRVGDQAPGDRVAAEVRRQLDG